MNCCIKNSVILVYMIDRNYCKKNAVGERLAETQCVYELFLLESTSLRIKVAGYK